MKKTLALLLALAMVLSLCACGKKTVKLGEADEKGVGRITITDVQLGSTNYVKANKMDDDFLTPIAKDDLQLNDQFVKSTDKNDGVIVITMIVEDIGKSDWTVYPFAYEVNYDNGNKYSSNTLYAKDDNGVWTKYESLKLEKVTSGAVEVRIAVWVPNVIIDSTSSLTLDFHGFTYTIR